MDERQFTAFTGTRLVASGRLEPMLRATKAYLDKHADAAVLIFDDGSGRAVDFDFTGTVDEVVAREKPAAPAPGPGRPKLGVVSREVSLMPRHWDWLESQPNGISATIRRLVEEASKREPEKQRARRAIDAASRVMTAIAGDRPGYEEASRALFAGDGERFRSLVRPWPKEIRGYLERLTTDAFVALDAAAGE